MKRLDIDALLKLPGANLGRTTGDGIASLMGADVRTAAYADEGEFQAEVVDFAEGLGWWAYHVYNARKSKAGWPDLVLLRHRIVVTELKIPPNTPDAAQLNCLERFRRAGVPAFVWTPDDWPMIRTTLTEGI